MSFRDLRNFTEMMRALGYKRLISMENFRTPNFPLVAEVLKWLVKRYDPNVDPPEDVDTEQDRVIFVKSIAQFLATKAHIKLNTKKLYYADGYAVKELLKVTSVLYSAMKTNVGNYDATADHSNISFDISSKIGDLKDARRLASEITARGATLYDLLGKEVDLREQRSTVIGRQLEITEVETSLAASIKAVEAEIKKTLHSIDSVASDEANLEAKIEKKRQELERNQKRLATLQSVRPAYMDDYERLEEDLLKLYEEYMLRFRNQAYLEQQLEECTKIEEDRKVEIEGRIVESINKEEKGLTTMHEPSDSEFSGLTDDGGDSEESDDGMPVQKPRPVHNRERPAPQGPSGPHIRGAMNPVDDEEDVEDDEDDSSGDSDISFDEHDVSISDDEIEIGPSASGRGGHRTQPKPPIDDDDDDF